jgi:AcrR family transcriptional regulator
MTPDPVCRRTTHGDQTRQEILRTAVDVASTAGLEGLTIGRLASELDMSKSGLFAHFGSKEDLQLATVDAARAIFVEKVIRPAFAAGRGLPRLQALMDAWLAYVQGSTFRGGCFFAAAAAEFDDRPGPVHDCLVGLLRTFFDILTEEARQAQELGQLLPTVAPTQIAFEMHAFVQETNGLYRLFQDAAVFRWAWEAGRRSLESAATPLGLRVLRGQDQEPSKQKVEASKSKQRKR